MHSYIIGIAKNGKTPIIKINGWFDHLHILLKLHPDVSLSVLIKELKAYSTSWMKKQGYGNFSWQLGYGAYSCSISHVDPVITYIDNQKVHHKTFSFEDELKSLNEKWGTTWSP